MDSVLAHCRNDLIQRQIRLLSDNSEYPLRMLLQWRDASSAWLWPRNALRLPAMQPSNCGTCADLQLLGGFTPRCSRFNKSNDSYSHFTGIRAAHGSPPKGKSMRINSLPTEPLGIPQFTSAGKRFKLNLRYCDVIADTDGVITRRNVNPGNDVLVGQSLMAIRSLNENWVDANFKETELRDLRIGQPVDLYVDMYGGRRVFPGRIAGFTIGTGSTLALLPPQNATATSSRWCSA